MQEKRFLFSRHSLEQMELRGISKAVVLEILSNPQQIKNEGDEKVYQSIVSFEKEGNYLIRIFVNDSVQPNVVITVYRTSKISKYQ